MNSIIQLSDCAEKHLRHYVDPNGTRAFAAYDRQGERHDGVPDQDEGEQRERDGGQQGHEWRQQDPPEPQRRDPHR